MPFSCQRNCKNQGAINSYKLYSESVLTYARGIISGSKDQLWCPIVPRTDIGNIGFSSDQLLCTNEKNKNKKKQSLNPYLKETNTHIHTPYLSQPHKTAIMQHTCNCFQ